MSDSLVRELLKTCATYSFESEEWSVPINEVLAGVDADEALWKPTASTPSIWEIVLHVAVWNENIARRIEARSAVHPPEGAWPALPEARGQANWESDVSRLDASLAILKRLAEETPLQEIAQGPYGVPDLVCRYLHVAYHIGQITKLREWYQATRRLASPAP